MKTYKRALIGISVLALSTSLYAAGSNFNCPAPSEVQSTDFTSPSIWVAPAVAHAEPGTVGVGLGGKTVKEFLGAEAAEVNHKKGWVCVYRAKGGIDVNTYKAKIKQVVSTYSFLRKYLDRVNSELDNAEPYLKKYPEDAPIGFVGYQQEE